MMPRYRDRAGCWLFCRPLHLGSLSGASKPVAGQTFCGMHRVAILLCVLLFLGGTCPGLKADHDGGDTPIPYRRHPVPAGWVIPTSYAATFWAAIPCQEGDVEHAQWRLTGPIEHTRREAVSHDGNETVSGYRCNLALEGNYELTCTFVDKLGNRSSVSWSITSTAEEFAGLGRKIAPSEVGSMVFL